MDLLYRYANLQCTAEEKQLVYEYLEADFSRCFELIKLMKMRAYKELRPEELLLEEECESCKKIDRQMSPVSEMTSIPGKEKVSGLGWLYNFFTDKDKEEAVEEFVDHNLGEMDEELLSTSLNEVLPYLKTDEVSFVGESDLVYRSSPVSLFTASGFLGLLEDYIDSPD